MVSHDLALTGLVAFGGAFCFFMAFVTTLPLYCSLIITFGLTNYYAAQICYWRHLRKLQKNLHCQEIF